MMSPLRPYARPLGRAFVRLVLLVLIGFAIYALSPHQPDIVLPLIPVK